MLGITGLVAILWWAFGLCFVFADVQARFIGSFTKFAFLKGVDSAQNTIILLGLAQRLLHVPDDVCHHHAGFDYRSDAERMKFSAILLFSAVDGSRYFPLAHMSGRND